MKKLVAKILVRWRIFLITITIIIIATFIGSYLLGSFIVQKNYEAEVQSYKAEVEGLNLQIHHYTTEVKSFIDIQEKYRAYTNEIVELLYSKESYLGTGGSGGQLNVNGDVSSIFLLKQAVDQQKDNLSVMAQVKDYLIARKQFTESFPFIWPIRLTGVPEITSGFGVRMNSVFKPGAKGIHFHAGIDIRGKRGEDIIATGKGRIYQVWDEDTSLGLHPLYGRLVIIEHAYGFKTYYGHLNKIIVKMGQVVTRGQKIGEMGDSGDSYGVHLHYEVRKDDIAIDPMNFLSTNY